MHMKQTTERGTGTPKHTTNPMIFKVRRSLLERTKFICKFKHTNLIHSKVLSRLHRQLVSKERKNADIVNYRPMTVFFFFFGKPSFFGITISTRLFRLFSEKGCLGDCLDQPYQTRCRLSSTPPCFL